MTVEIRSLEGMSTTVLNMRFNDSATQGVSIFLEMTPQEVIAHLESQIAIIKEGIAETNAILDDHEAMDAIAEAQADIDNDNLTDYAKEFDSSPLGQVINSIFGK